MKVAFVLHNPAGSSGMIGEILRQRGHQIEVFCPIGGDPLPVCEDCEAVVVFGGKMSANDCRQLPALMSELLWIRRIVERGRPYLGICLGAQLLAMSFGARILRHPQKLTEIGYYPIFPTDRGRSEIFSNLPSRFFQWHNEGFTMPEAAIKLASGTLYPNQAFRIGARAFGFQFHPEATAEQIHHWHQRDSEELKNPGAQEVAVQFDYCQRLTAEIHLWLEQFLSSWLHNEESQ